uniref:Putative golgin-84 n=1 Tax=Tabanus bromius TaxID=304241 RepID=A0A0K8TTL7_TABBR
MSWITGLAGRAEDILNKLDQNAANVLQQPHRVDVENDEVTVIEEKQEESIVEGLKRNLSSTSLSLTRSLTPRKLAKSENLNGSRTDDQFFIKSEKGSSNLSSRRSSISSRADGISNGQEEIAEISPPKKIQMKKIEGNFEKELATVKIALAQISAERDELQNDLSTLQESMKEIQDEKRLQEVENVLRSVSSERDQLKMEIEKLQITSSDYVKSISELETNLAKSNQNVLRLTEKLEWQTKETEQAVSDLEQYRKKAQATLQMKDKLIEELKSNKSQGAENSNEKALNYEIEGLRQENQHLADELKTTLMQLDNSKEFLQKLEKQIEDKNNEISKIQNALKENLGIEQQRSNQLETEVKILNQEVSVMRDEMNRQRQTLLARISEKDKEITKLKSNSSDNGLNDVNNLEDRVQFLTQALVQKQASIETVTAERNALKLQLEKTEDQLRHLMAQQRQQRVQIINVNDTDDAKAQLPFLMRETPFDTNVARKMKRAYSSLDSAGIRIGVFLRRYPLIRIAVIMYIALLHLWVMFVLLSSTPT